MALCTPKSQVQILWRRVSDILVSNNNDSQTLSYVLKMHCFTLIVYLITAKKVTQILTVYCQPHMSRSMKTWFSQRENPLKQS